MPDTWNKTEWIYDPENLILLGQIQLLELFIATAEPLTVRVGPWLNNSKSDSTSDMQMLR